MLCFNVKVLPDALKFAKENNIKLIQKDIIYHLVEDFNKHAEEIKKRQRA